MVEIVFGSVGTPCIVLEKCHKSPDVISTLPQQFSRTLLGDLIEPKTICTTWHFQWPLGRCVRISVEPRCTRIYMGISGIQQVPSIPVALAVVIVVLRHRETKLKIPISSILKLHRPSTTDDR